MINKIQAFLFQGNVLALAVGVIIGAAFSKIIDSLVTNIIMPVIGVLTGGVDFSKLSFKVGEATIGYGAFIQSVFDFIIIGTVLYFLITAAERATKKASPAPAGPTTESLLAEIRQVMQNIEANTRK
jgi:large conductance mechanosensitive channel